MEKLLELRREYLQEVVARGGGQAREYLEDVAMANRDLERGECREVEIRDFRAEVDESKRPRKARWDFMIEFRELSSQARRFVVITIFLRIVVREKNGIMWEKFPN